MEELLASLDSQTLSLQFAQEIEGTVVAILDKEVVLDLGTKSEGILPKKDLTPEQLKSLKVGDKFKSYVAQVENEFGQTILSVHKQFARRPSFGRSRGRNIDWSRFTQVMNQNSKLSGNVVEVNKGGLILEVEGTRGFLPGSQIGIDALGKLVGAGNDIVGQNLQAQVIEIDQNNNRLIFSQKGMATDEVKKKLDHYKTGEGISDAKMVAVYPFGAVAEFSGLFFIIYPQDIAWEKTEDPTAVLKVGDEVSGKILSVDKDYGRITLSLKAAKEDPFTKVAESFQADDVVSATVSAVSAQGVAFTLKDGIEGFMPSSKMGSGTYEVGQKINCLVDSVDTNRRRVNLVPMLTSTEGLIYK